MIALGTQSETARPIDQNLLEAVNERAMDIMAAVYADDLDSFIKL
jgi:hypothetical protein